MGHTKIFLKIIYVYILLYYCNSLSGFWEFIPSSSIISSYITDTAVLNAFKVNY